MLLEGIHLPLTTPFFPDGRLNLKKLAHNVELYSKTPAAGLLLLGPSGEPTLLSDTETCEVLRAAAEAASNEKVLLAGVSRDSVAATLALAEYAAKARYDAILIGLPSVLSQRSAQSRLREMLIYFQAVADRAALPVVLMSSTSARIPIEIVAELANHTHIIGLLAADCGPDEVQAMVAQTAGAPPREVIVTSVFAAVTERMQRASGPPAALVSAATLTSGVAAVAEVAPASKPLRTRTKQVGFQLLIGDTLGMHNGLKAGAVGAITTFSACAPQACYEVYAAWKDNDQPLAVEKQERLRDAARYVELELGPAALKFGCDLNGYFGGHPRLPLLPLTGAQRTEIERVMQGLRS